MGLVGSSTPFHTEDGRPFSLFKGEEVYQDGAIGIAIIDSKGKAKELVVDYAGMESFGGAPMEVTQCVTISLHLTLIANKDIQSKRKYCH